MHTATKTSPQARPLWASPAGKYRTAKYLAGLLPAHNTYVEPFAGSGAVFFAKSKAEVEVVNDINQAIADAFQSAANLDTEQQAELASREWVGSRPQFKAMLSASATTDVERLHQFIYTTQFSFLKRRQSFSPCTEGKRYPVEQRLSAALPRLRGVTVECGDYEAVVRKYDAEDTVFFFDPPYVATSGGVGEQHFDEGRFCEVLKSIRGKFLLTYGTRGSLPGLCAEAGFSSMLQFWKRDHGQAHTVSGAPRLATYIIANYPLPQEARPETTTFQKALPLLKALPEEQYLLGVVLEPDVVDAHGDIYGAADIRKAAHGFMEHSQVMGHMHRWQANDRVRILESYLLPADTQYGDYLLRKGTWMLGVRVIDEALWQSVRRGEITGFSIGGSARRTPMVIPEARAA